MTDLIIKPRNQAKAVKEGKATEEVLHVSQVYREDPRERKSVLGIIIASAVAVSVVSVVSMAGMAWLSSESLDVAKEALNATQAITEAQVAVSEMGSKAMEVTEAAAAEIRDVEHGYVEDDEATGDASFIQSLIYTAVGCVILGIVFKLCGVGK